MRPSVFISRDSHRAQSFVESIQQEVDSVTCKSLLTFSLIHSDLVPAKGWLFFYSQSAVDFFLQQKHAQALLKDDNLRIAAFGAQTASYLSAQGIEVSFQGDSNAKTTSARFLTVHQPKTITFVRGAHSLNSLKAYLPEQVIIQDMIVYDHGIAQIDTLPEYDILVFTSPMNVDAFCKANTINENQWTVAIGPTTAVSILNHHIDKVIIAKEPSMNGLAEAVLSILK